MPLSPTERLLEAIKDTYAIERELPRGGMSRLFLARDTALDRQVVIKVLPQDLVNNANLARFRREIELTVKLQHPHILPVLSAGAVEDLHYYVTPFVPGESLRERISNGPLPVHEVQRILVQMLEAIAFAHSRHVIHRDIKPGNILLLEGNAVLADFGIARAVIGEETITQTLSMPGTPAYMAPDRPHDASADLYALGVVGYEMLTGARPATGATVADRKRYQGDASPAEFDVLASTVAQLIDPDPKRRIRTAPDALDALHGRVVNRRRSMNRALVAAVLAAMVLAAGAWSVRVYTRSSTRALVQSRDALRDGDLTAAIVHARRAVQLDSQDTDARMLLGREILYSDADSLRDEGKSLLAALLANPHNLERRDSLRAEGWLALFSRDAVRACEIFARDSSANPHDFDALFGLGECRRRDRGVIPDPAASERFVFRGSYHGAATAYEAALVVQTGPSPAFVYQRLRQVLITETNRLRSGTGPNQRQYMGYPSVSGDTIAFFPEQLSAGHMIAVPPSRGRALDLSTARLRHAYAGWVRKTPNDPLAHRYLSEVLEDVGNVAESGVEEVSALDEIRRARALARDTMPSLLAIQVRQLIRAQQFAAARALADSGLARWRDLSVARATTGFAGLAVMTGKLSLVVNYGRELSAVPRYVPTVRGTEITLPLEFRYARADLTALSSLGVCDQRVRDLASRIIRWATVDFPSYATDPEAQLAILERPLTLSLSCVGEPAARVIAKSRDPLVGLTLALSPAQHFNQAASLRAANAAHALERPGDMTPDHVIVEAELYLAAHDTAAAYERLERTITALPSLSSGSMLQVPSAGGIVRSMALGARLAMATGRADKAKAWASAVVALWSGADAELQPTVAEMRKILASAAR